MVIILCHKNGCHGHISPKFDIDNYKNIRALSNCEKRDFNCCSYNYVVVVAVYFLVCLALS